MHSSLPAEYSSHECLAAPAGRDWFPTEWEGGCGGGGGEDRERKGEEEGEERRVRERENRNNQSQSVCGQYVQIRTARGHRWMCIYIWLPIMCVMYTVIAKGNVHCYSKR